MKLEDSRFILCLKMWFLEHFLSEIDAAYFYRVQLESIFLIRSIHKDLCITLMSELIILEVQFVCVKNLKA